MLKLLCPRELRDRDRQAHDVRLPMIRLNEHALAEELFESITHHDRRRSYRQRRASRCAENREQTSESAIETCPTRRARAGPDAACYHIRMQSFRRRLFASVSVLSLVCCLATVGLWVRSYWAHDQVRRYLDGATGFMVATDRGGLDVFWGVHRTTVNPADGWFFSTHKLPPPFDGPMFDLVYVDAKLLSFSRTGRTLTFPFWLPAVLFAFAPAYWLLGPWRRQAKRRKLGLCLTCGYDLRASPERCPECGAIPDDACRALNDDQLMAGDR